MAVPAMDGTMAASYLTMRGQKRMIGQHDDRFYHRRRWERSERSETTSASRIEYPNRCDWRCSHDRERCIRRVRNNSVGCCHVEIFVRPMRYKGCQQAHNAQVVLCALFTTRNSLKFYRGGERRFHPFAKFVPYRKGCAHNQARQPSNPSSCAAPYVPPSRFPPLEVCVRRPRCAPRHRHGAGIRKPSQIQTWSTWRTRRALSDRRSAYCKSRERSREDTGGPV